MNVLRLKELQIARLRLPGDFPRRVEEEKGKDRVRSIREHGLIHPPMVRVETQEVITGVFDIAAMVAAGETKVRCQLVECTDDELQILREQEVLQQKRLSPEERHAAVDRYTLLLERQEERRIVEERIRDPEANGLLFRRPKTAARERLAEVLGVSVDAVKQRELRARKRLREIGPFDGPEEAFKRFGMELTEEFEDRLMAAKAGLRKITNALEVAQRAMGALKKAKLDLPETRTKRLQAMIDEAVKWSKACKPVGLCPYCKGIPEVCNKCLSCNGSAVLFGNQVEGILPELKNKENPVVYVQGEGFKPIGAFATSGNGADVRLVEKEEADDRRRETNGAHEAAERELANDSGGSEPIEEDPWGIGSREGDAGETA